MFVRKAVINNINDLIDIIKKTKCHNSVYESFIKKGIFNIIIIEKIDNISANILKQEAISIGSDVAINKDISKFKKGVSDVVLFVSSYKINKLIEKLEIQCFSDLKRLAVELKSITLCNEKKFKYKNCEIDISNPVVMGIINMDLNSFSGDGFINPDLACKRAIEFEKNGAKIIDIGGESSRPGSDMLDVKIEINRVIPALKKIRKNVSIPISIDTYKYETAKIAIEEGADIINDIFALKYGGEKLAKLISNTKTGIIIMHTRGIPKNMQINPVYKNCVSEIYNFLNLKKKYLNNFGVEDDYIAVDPGIGFGKSVEHNIELIKNMNIFSSIGVVVGAVSRKNFIKSISGNNSKFSFVTMNFIAALYGANILRVHDVKETVDILNIIKMFKRNIININ
ncbi:MAG: dihydropteroate synthase [Endomicrobium sp.]|jgi:dihydropteroate synthase|nr:dihydropteroate synthase [Endomicrobium sp.]